MQDYTNNEKAMNEIASSDYKSDFLHVAGEVILESVLEALVQALIVRAGVGHIDLGCSLCKQSDVVLAAEG